MDDQEIIAEILEREELSLENVKAVMRTVRYGQEGDERFEYANTLLSDAADYLPPYWLRALVRADITEDEASLYLARNKAFFSRLANLLPSIVRFFSEEERSRNPRGIIDSVDGCHADFHFTAASSRRDRQLRQAKERLAKASRLASDLAATLEESKEHCHNEFERYHAVYYPASHRVSSRSLGDLIDELRLCGGVMEIVRATADRAPKRLFLFGNDQRKTVVECAYHMCTVWNGPKLVTSPGSDFAALCSLLFEAVSGRSDEGLAGAINRYARSDDRRQWDREGEEDPDEDDNFLNQKNAMAFSAQQIELCKKLLQNANLSEMARDLLRKRIDSEQKKYDEARTKYGPHQVYISQMNDEQWNNILLEAYNRLKPEQRLELDEQISVGKTLAMADVELGRTRRSARTQN
jgi:hypothetical protein